MSAFMQWNLEILALIAESRIAFFDWFFSLVTWLGSEYIIIVVVTLLFLCFNKKLAFKMGISFFVSSAVVQLLKIGCRIERPWVLVKDYPELAERYSPLDMFGAVEGATGYSFPSGHTQSALSLYGALGLSAKKTWMKIVLFAVAIAIAYSRLYLGVHTPLDVVTSFLLTLVIILAVGYVFDRFYENGKIDIGVAAVVALVSLAAIIYSCALYESGKIPEFDMVADCVKMASCGIGFAISFVIDRRYIKFEPQKGSVKSKILRTVIGVAGVFGLKEGLKMLGIAIFGKEIIAMDIARYFLMIIFVVTVIPVAIKYLDKRKKASSEQ